MWVMPASWFAGVAAFACALLLGVTAPAESELAASTAAGLGSASQGERLPGIDVSRFDGEIRWDRVAGAGIEFAFVQASRGAGDDCPVKPRRCGRDGF